MNVIHIFHSTRSVYELPVVRPQSENKLRFLNSKREGGYPDLQSYLFSHSFLTYMYMKMFHTESDNKT